MRDCAQCGARFRSYHGRQRFCGQRCQRRNAYLTSGIFKLAEIATPERRKQIRERYALRLATAPGTASPEAIAARIAFYGDRCWVCRAPAEQIDHVIPLSRGGSNWPANLRPICAACNQHKGARLVTREQLRRELRPGHLSRVIARAARQAGAAA